ncbi:MAG TPA: hypothetical protein VJ385_12245 [Fibrobacteria bacterium]|nr:hypothetical protein [Fibrobacteria bacterium]
MGLRHLLTACGAKLNGLLRARRIRSAIFSGSPVLSGIAASADEPGTWCLTYRNGLMLTLGEAGILDYQDREFGHFIGGQSPGAAPDNRDFLVQLHKLVLKSLLRYIIHPGLDLSQRERAAEAATKLWLASENRPGKGPDHSMVDNGSWTAVNRAFSG